MKITFIGSGYVGLVSGACISDFNHSVICMDIDKNKINKLSNGQIPIFEPGLTELINKNFNKKRLSFTSNLEFSINNSDVIFLAVGTPSDNNGRTFSGSDELTPKVCCITIVACAGIIGLTLYPNILAILTTFLLSSARGNIIS